MARLTKEQWSRFFDESPYWAEIKDWLDSQTERNQTDFERCDPEHRVHVARIQCEINFIKKMTSLDFKEKLFENGRKRDDH